MPIIHLMLNENNIGDSQNVEAVGAAIEVKLNQHGIIKQRYQDNAPDVTESLETKLDQNQQHVLVISGTHGLDLLEKLVKNQQTLELIKNRKLTIAWSGHQAPKKLTELENYIAVAGLVQEAIDSSLESKFGERLVSTKMVPNTINRDSLKEAIKLWHSNPNNSKIPTSNNGFVGVFLGGDAPDKDNNYKCMTKEQAFIQGKAFGALAKKLGKTLLVTNGPRMGQIYPESVAIDPKKPSFTRFKDGKWVKYSDLTEEERNTKPDDYSKAHAETRKITDPNTSETKIVKAPLDEVSDNFELGIKASGLEDYLFEDFRFKNSAYQALVATLLSQDEQSLVFYSGESVSYAELCYVLANVYAFEVESMNDLHRNILKRFNEQLGMIGIAKASENGIEIIRQINKEVKTIAIARGLEEDANKIADAILAKLTLDAQPVTWRAPGSTSNLMNFSKSGQETSTLSSDVLPATDVSSNSTPKSKA